tara:strand:- start:2026 stop:2163 length:138 start_codon:yes stop_codon:yes gene_type:complete
MLQPGQSGLQIAGADGVNRRALPFADGETLFCASFRRHGPLQKLC